MKFDYTQATVAQIDKAIGMIQKRGNQLQDMIQAVGIACMYQVQQHGNVTPINKLYTALPEGQRKTAFALWAVKYGGVQINEDQKARKVVPLAYRDKHDIDIPGATVSPWYKMKTEKSLDDVVLDVQAEVEKLLKKISKSKRVSDPVLAEKLAALVVADDATAPGVALAVPALPVNLPAQMH